MGKSSVAPSGEVEAGVPVEAGWLEPPEHADNFDALIQDKAYGLRAQARMLAPIGRRTEGLVRVIADADDVAIAQGIIQSGQRVFYVLGRDGLAALFVGHIEHHAATEIPL